MMVWNKKNTDLFWRCSALNNQLYPNIFLFLVTCEFHKRKELWIDFWRPRNIALFIPCPGLG